MIRVRTDLAAYRAAVAELPESTLLVDERADVVVIAGQERWGGAAARAIDGGARAVIVERPVPDAGDLDALTDDAVPVVLARHGLRPDDARDAVTAVPSAVTVHLLAPRRGLAPSLVDAVGWARVLAGGDLTLRAIARTGQAVLADLAYVGGGVALVASERLDARGACRWRVTTVAVERVDIVSDGAVATVTRTSRAGDLILPRRWESPARLALRRVAAALDQGADVDDVAQWRHDAARAASIMAGHPTPTS